MVERRDGPSWLRDDDNDDISRIRDVHTFRSFLLLRLSVYSFDQALISDDISPISHSYYSFCTTVSNQCILAYIVTIPHSTFVYYVWQQMLDI